MDKEKDNAKCSVKELSKELGLPYPLVELLAIAGGERGWPKAIAVGCVNVLLIQIFVETFIPGQEMLVIVALVGCALFLLLADRMICSIKNELSKHQD